MPELDLLRAQAQLATTEAQLPGLQGQASAEIFALGVLAGGDPMRFVETLSPVAPLPALPADVSVGQRAAMLLRRPDVIAAERALAAATAQYAGSRAERYPRFAFNASGGYNAGDFARLFEGDSIQWLLNPVFTLPVFQGGRVSASIEAAQARAEQALQQYRKAVYGSLQEAETGLVLFEREQATLGRLTDAETASADAATIASRLYDSGLGDFLAVLDAQRRLTEVQNARIQSRTRAALRLVDLYKAVGGAIDG